MVLYFCVGYEQLIRIIWIICLGSLQNFSKLNLCYVIRFRLWEDLLGEVLSLLILAQYLSLSYATKMLLLAYNHILSLLCLGVAHCTTKFSKELGISTFVKMVTVFNPWLNDTIFTNRELLVYDITRGYSNLILLFFWWSYWDVPFWTAFSFILFPSNGTAFSFLWHFLDNWLFTEGLAWSILRAWYSVSYQM